MGPSLLLLEPADPRGSGNHWAQPAEQPSWASRFPRGRVLVVDDDTIVRGLIARLLEEAGYEVETAPDGASALGAISSTAAPFDLVVTDIRMPAMDGWELGRRIQRERATPVLYVTGYDSVQPPSNHLTFLRKPFEAEDLLARVGRLLGGG